MLARTSGLQGGAAQAPPGRPARSRRWLPLLTLVGGIALAGCQAPTFMAFRSADKQGNSTFNLWSGMVIAALVVGAFILGLIFWAVLRYRRPRHDTGGLPKQTRYNLPWEIAYTVTPIFLVVVIFVFTVIVENTVDATPPHPNVQVRVTAYRWGWIFDYTGTPVSVHTTSTSYPTLMLPENETTEISLVSNDVVHELLVPNFLFGRYAQPGIVNKFDFTPTKTGVYPGHCDEYCGLYHAEMLFNVRVVPPSTFSSWLSSQETKATA